jgi:hypothetical protein
MTKGSGSFPSIPSKNYEEIFFGLYMTPIFDTSLEAIFR